MPQSGSRKPRQAAMTPAQLARPSPPPLAYSGERYTIKGLDSFAFISS